MVTKAKLNNNMIVIKLPMYFFHHCYIVCDILHDKGDKLIFRDIGQLHHSCKPTQITGSTLNA